MFVTLIRYMYKTSFVCVRQTNGIKVAIWRHNRQVAGLIDHIIPSTNTAKTLYKHSINTAVTL
jgi:predicted RNA binding protein with dsRBD fold (UPF0201 family)